MKYDWELTEEEFGPFYPFIQDKNVTDIDYNGKQNHFFQHPQNYAYIAYKQTHSEKFQNTNAEKANQCIQKQRKTIKYSADAFPKQPQYIKHHCVSPPLSQPYTDGQFPEEKSAPECQSRRYYGKHNHIQL